MVQACYLVYMLFSLFFENCIFTNYNIYSNLDIIRIFENLGLFIKLDFIYKT